MSVTYSCRSNISSKGSCEGSAVSDLSGPRHLASTSDSPRCSLSDLEGRKGLGRLQKIRTNEPKSITADLHPIPIFVNELDDASSHLKQRVEKCENGEIAHVRGDLNIQSCQDTPSIDSRFKSLKKRPSSGLMFNIPFFKEARSRFSKKKVQYSTPIAKEAKQENEETEKRGLYLKDFFPHVMTTKLSPHLTQSSLARVNSTSPWFPSDVDDVIPPNFHPHARFTSISIRKDIGETENVNKFPKNGNEKNKLENGNDTDQHLEIENGNYLRKGETKIVKEKIISRELFSAKKLNTCEETDSGDCFCILSNQNQKWYRKNRRRVLQTKSKGISIASSCHPWRSCLSSEYAHTLQHRRQIPETDLSKMTSLGIKGDLGKGDNKVGEVCFSEVLKLDEQTRSKKISSFSRKEKTKTVISTDSKAAVDFSLDANSSDQYDISSDEEGIVDTSFTSDEGLTSNLSLFTSAEGEDDGIGTTDDNLYYDRRIERENHRTNLSYVSRDSDKNCISPTMKQEGANLDSKLEPNRQENFKKWYLATQKLEDARGGISTQVKNKELREWELSPQNSYWNRQNPPPRNFVGQKVQNKPRNLVHIRNSRYGQGKNHRNAYQIPLGAVSSMKGGIPDFQTKLENSSRDEDTLASSISSVQLTHAHNEREINAKVDHVTQQYEERITELHSVIAELTRKLDRQRHDVILEEEEDDDLEEEEEEDEALEGEETKERRRRSPTTRTRTDEGLSVVSEVFSHIDSTDCETSETAESSEHLFDQEGPVPHPRPHTRPPTDISTSCEIDDRAVEAGECIADLDVSGCKARSQGNLSASHPCNDNATDDVPTDDIMGQASSSVGFEEELKGLREENNNLQQALTLAQNKVTNQRSAIMALSREREILRKKLKEFEKMQPGIPLSSPQISDAIMVKGLRGSPLSGSILGPTGAGEGQGQPSSRSVSPMIMSQTSCQEEQVAQDGVKVICKLAERVRLKKAQSGDLRVTGSDLSSVGVSSTAVAEQLAAGVQEESDAQELFHALATAGGAFAPHERFKEYELETERLHARIDHLRAQNDVLCATLSESKACCDRLALKTGRAEAQSGALKMGVDVLDQIQEAFEVLTALHEAQIALLIVTCQVTGVELGPEMGFDLGDQDIEPLIRVRRAQEQRRTAENVARHLLSRLQGPSSKPMTDSTEMNGVHSLSSSSSSFSFEGPHQEEQMLRVAISRLQEERTRILSCLKGCNESSPLEDYFPSHLPLDNDEAHKLDLENAVLMQELTAIREDRAELRAQVYLLEREKTGLELRIGTCEAQTAAYWATIDHLKGQINQLKGQQDTHENVGDSGVDTASSEAESLRRENQLKTRVDDLVSTLEKVTKNSEARHRQSQEFISDLKKANSALLTAVDRMKKKYTLRVKRMEQQTLNLVSKHEQQVKTLKERISTLEGQSQDHFLTPAPNFSTREENL